MKKIIFATFATAMLLVSCDPSHDENGPDAGVTTSQLTQEFQLVAQSEGNNNFTVYTSPTRYIRVYDNSNDGLVGQGTKVTFQAVPPAGEREYYIETQNQDGTTVKSEVKKVTVTSFTELPEIFEKVFGKVGEEYQTSTWTWDDTLAMCWGNGGWGSDTGPAWWGYPVGDDLESQASSKGLPGDGLSSAWFSLSLSGVKTSRGETGTVNVSENSVQAGWDIGTMTFTGTVPLLGVLPNDGDIRCYTYQILKADGDKLVLAANSTSGWEGWFLAFKKIDNK